MTEQELLQNLAITLEVQTDDILTYQDYGSKGYTVILTNYQKFTGIQLATIEEPTIDIADLYPDTMPANLRPIYDNPNNYKLKELRELASFLKIKDASTLRKAQLLSEIISWKDGTFVPFLEEE